MVDALVHGTALAYRIHRVGGWDRQEPPQHPSAPCGRTGPVLQLVAACRFRCAGQALRSQIGSSRLRPAILWTFLQVGTPDMARQQCSLCLSVSGTAVAPLVRVSASSKVKGFLATVRFSGITVRPCQGANAAADAVS